MRQLKIFIVLILFVSISGIAKAERKLPPVDSLSESAYITLLTCDPGAMLYSTFGHSAFGVVDPEQGINWVFNYGTFNFNTPHFYLKFASGKLLYKLGIERKDRFLREYRYEKRRVIEDKLNLTPDQKQKLFDALLENYKPENRYYQYDFFFDNCATRILDLLYHTLGDSLQFIPPDSIAVKTFRNLIDEYLVHSHWSDFGIDIALGSVIDKPATEREKAFLPDYLKLYLDHTVINGKPFLHRSRMVVGKSVPLPETPFYLSPELWIWVIFALVLLLSVVYRHKSWIIADRIIFSTFGIVGVIVFLLWFATDHDATAGNLNLLWANPLYLIYVWFIGAKKTKVLQWFSVAVLFLNLTVLLAWFVLPQQYHVLFIPIITLLALRSGILVLRNWH